MLQSKHFNMRTDVFVFFFSECFAGLHVLGIKVSVALGQTSHRKEQTEQRRHHGLQTSALETYI